MTSVPAFSHHGVVRGINGGRASDIWRLRVPGLGASPLLERTEDSHRGMSHHGDGVTLAASFQAPELARTKLKRRMRLK